MNCRSILPEFQCPYCWQKFTSQTLLYISQHPELLGDFRLGENEPTRFLPTRFRSDGSAIDAGGFPSRLLACPYCHREIPRVLIEVPMAYFACVSSPALQSEYHWDPRRFLVSMLHSLRLILPPYFALHLTDADPKLNLPLLEYERIDSSEPMAKSFDMPQPFLFAMTPGKEHPHRDQTALVSRVLSFYAPWTTSQMTRLLASMAVPLTLFWMVTPTTEHLQQDAESIETLGKTLVEINSNSSFPCGPIRLYIIVPSKSVESASIESVSKSFGTKDADAKTHDPLDKNHSLRLSEPPSVWKYTDHSSVATLRSTIIDAISSQTCDMLRSRCPTFNAAVTRWFPEVMYFPVHELSREEMTHVTSTLTSWNAETSTKSLGTESSAERISFITEHMIEIALPILWTMATSLQGVIQRTLSKKRSS